MQIPYCPSQNQKNLTFTHPPPSHLYIKLNVYHIRRGISVTRVTRKRITAEDDRMDNVIEKERNNRKRKGKGPAPVLYSENESIEKIPLNDDLPLEEFVKKVLHSHRAIIKAFRLLDLQDSLYLLKSSDVVLFFRNREKRLRRLIKGFRNNCYTVP